MFPLSFVLLLGTAPAGPDWAALEAQGARITEIRVEVQDVFDLNDPKENNLLGRLADKLHRDTREGVIRRALLFQVGDPVSARHIHETERQLRGLDFLKDAEIVPEPLGNGAVRAHVRVRDAWTLKFSIHYKLLGGQTTRGFALQEQNLLGTGKTLVFNWVRDPVRTTETFGYRDSQVLGSSWSMIANYANLSDGSSRQINLTRPFQSLDTPWSATFQAATAESTFALDDRGVTVYQAHSKVDKRLAGAAWAVARDGDAVWRAGVQVADQEARYGPMAVDTAPGGLPAPDLEPRMLRGPALTLGYLQDRYGTWRDLAAVDATEDYNLGWSWDLAAGKYLPAWGAGEAAPYLQADLGKGWSTGENDLLLLQASASGRRGDRGWEDTLADVTVIGYWKQTPDWIGAACLNLDRALRADPEDVMYLGANEGLRAYPNDLHPGDGRWLLSLEQRALTDERWLGILRLGFVAFADLGGIHRQDGAGWTAPYVGLGGGLRLGDLKSSLGRVVLVTASKPVTQTLAARGWQITVGNVVRF